MNTPKGGSSHERPPFGSRTGAELLSALLHLSKALAAVNRTIVSGLEGHSGLSAAGGAGGGEELTGATGGILAGVTASLAENQSA